MGDGEMLNQGAGRRSCDRRVNGGELEEGKGGGGVWE